MSHVAGQITSMYIVLRTRMEEIVGRTTGAGITMAISSVVSSGMRARQTERTEQEKNFSKSCAV